MAAMAATRAMIRIVTGEEQRAAAQERGLHACAGVLDSVDVLSVNLDRGVTGVVDPLFMEEDLRGGERGFLARLDGSRGPGPRPRGRHPSRQPRSSSP